MSKHEPDLGQLCKQYHDTRVTSIGLRRDMSYLSALHCLIKIFSFPIFATARTFRGSPTRVKGQIVVGIVWGQF